jgi:hypothetical protein
MLVPVPRARRRVGRTISPQHRFDEPLLDTIRYLCNPFGVSVGLGEGEHLIAVKDHDDVSSGHPVACAGPFSSPSRSRTTLPLATCANDSTS